MEGHDQNASKCHKLQQQFVTFWCNIGLKLPLVQRKLFIVNGLYGLFDYSTGPRDAVWSASE